MRVNPTQVYTPPFEPRNAAVCAFAASLGVHFAFVWVKRSCRMDGNVWREVSSLWLFLGWVNIVYMLEVILFSDAVVVSAFYVFIYALCIPVVIYGVAVWHVVRGLRWRRAAREDEWEAVPYTELT